MFIVASSSAKMVKACEKGEAIGKAAPAEPTAVAIEKIAESLLELIGIEKKKEETTPA